jgi:hypothetical protein
VLRHQAQQPAPSHEPTHGTCGGHRTHRCHLRAPRTSRLRPGWHDGDGAPAGCRYRSSPDERDPMRGWPQTSRTGVALSNPIRHRCRPHTRPMSWRDVWRSPRRGGSGPVAGSGGDVRGPRPWLRAASGTPPRFETEFVASIRGAGEPTSGSRSSQIGGLSLRADLRKGCRPLHTRTDPSRHDRLRLDRCHIPLRRPVLGATARDGQGEHSVSPIADDRWRRVPTVGARALNPENRAAQPEMRGTSHARRF